MNRAVFAALSGHWRRHPLQAFTLIAGLALATALWSGVQAINAEARASYDAAAATLGEGRYDQLIMADGGPIPMALYVALRRAGWLVSPVVDGQLGDVRLVGIDPMTAPAGMGPVRLGQGADIAAFLSETGQIFARADVLATLPATGAALVASPDLAPGTAIADLALAQRLLGRTGQVSRLIVLPQQPLRQTALAQVAPGLTLRAAQGTDIGRLTDSFHLNLTAFGLLSFAVGIFIVQGAVGLAFEQRRGLVRTLRALGLPLRRLLMLMAAELLALALVAGVLGVALGYLIAAALLPDVAATIRGLYGAQVAGTLALRPGWLASGLAIAVLGAGLAGVGALGRIARAPLLDSGQGGAGIARAARVARWQARAAGAMIAGAGTLALTGQGLIAGFGMLALLLIGGALALPPILAWLLRRAAGLARGPVAQWIWADARAGLPGLSLALMALLLAMAANIGVATMVSSFRLTFTAFLDQRLASELYVQTADAAQAAAVLATVTPLVDAVLPLMSVVRTVAGQPAEVFAARDHATYRQNWQFLAAVPGVWDLLAQGQGALVNEQLSRRGGLALGDMVAVADGSRLPVIGIYGDYGNPAGQVILTESLFVRLFPTVIPLRFGLRLDPAAVPVLRQTLIASGLPASQIINQKALKQFSLQVFERTFAVTAALNVLTLAVAGFALLMSLLTLGTMRLPALAPVWAMGMTQAALGRIELLRNLMLAGLTCVLALPLGLALAWALLTVVNVAAFGWQLPVHLFPLDYLRLGALALLAATLAAAWPAWRLARTAPAALTRVFADER